MKNDQRQVEINFIEWFDAMQALVHQTAIEKGWWEKPRDDGTCIALMHSELSEALEGLRIQAPSDKIPLFESVEEELADTIIRIMDFAAQRGLNIAAALVTKAEYNKGREHRHGGKQF